MTGEILTINAGSSNLKVALFAIEATGDLVPVFRGRMDHESGSSAGRQIVDQDGRTVEELSWPQAVQADDEQIFADLVGWAEGRGQEGSIIAVGHRVVHGGRAFAAPVRLSHEVLEKLDRLTPLAPLHQPHNLVPIRALMKTRPDLAQVACFDTAFHRGRASVTTRFALPRDYEAAGIERYGFHGLSYEYIAGALPSLAPGSAADRVIVAHLGGGASLCALRNGKSVDTTMSFTALDGVPMGTRCGALDPGVVLFLIRERGMSAAAVEDLLYNRSGLLGVSGLSGDMRVLLSSNEQAAADAVDLFTFRVAREIGALAATLEGLDGLVFTGGVGEHAAEVRQQVCRRAEWLGISLDDAANDRGDLCISDADSRVSVWVIPTDEESVIARHALTTIGYQATYPLKAAERPNVTRSGSE